MDKRKILGIGTLAVALVLSVVAVTVAFANYNSDLEINGSASAIGTHWSVIFSNLQSANIGNDTGIATTTVEVTAPQIIGETAIGTYEVQLETPGDYITYNFNIENTGNFNAKIDTSFVMPTPTCTKSATGKDTDAANVCDNLEYTLKYVDDGSDVKVGDTFNVGDSKEVQLKLYYKSIVTSAEEMPFDDVAIENLDIIIPFVQY